MRATAMKVRMEMEIDLESGIYDVRFHNLTDPGEEIDVQRLGVMVQRVLDNVASKTEQADALSRGWSKSEIN